MLPHIRALYYKQDISVLEKVQRHGARFVTGIYSYRESVNSMIWNNRHYNNGEACAELEEGTGGPDPL